MRLLIAALLLLLVLLQLLFWFGESGQERVRELERAVEMQNEENAELVTRNAALQAEVEDLREGLDAIEERARNELGLIREGEVFYQVVTPQTEESAPIPR